MSYRSLVACALLIAGGSPALAQDEAATPAKPKPVKEHKICRQDVATGSIMPRSTCHTKAEWAQIDAANQANAEQFRSQMRMSGTGKGN